MMEEILAEIEKYRYLEVTEKQWNKIDGDLNPGANVDIYWIGLGSSPDQGYLFALPCQAPDEGDILIHIPHPQNPDGMDDGWPQWVHLINLLKNKRVKKIICKGGY